MPDLFTQAGLYAEIAVPLPVPGTFTYAVPDTFKDSAVPGVRVLVPFKNREMLGYIVNIHMRPPEFDAKPLLSILDSKPILSPAMIALTEWIGRYYCSGWGEAIENALPRWVKFGKKAEKAVKKSKIKAEADIPEPPQFELTPDQSRALSQIMAELDAKERRPILLRGVTGSGKSEVYIRMMREVLHRQGTVICLVPEIALTEQLRLFFLGHFGSDLEILHSKLSDAERFLAWHRIEQGERKIVLGPRSAVFAPLKNLKLIIMDEEHEGSYKQETSPRYHARDVAEWRAAHENALFLMGSATPSLETMCRAEKGAVLRLDLFTRVDERAMPEVRIFDLKDSPDKKRFSLFMPQLRKEIETNLMRGEGVMLLLNRRGFSTHISCPQCGQVETCQSCQVSLTHHQETGVLICHYCNFQRNASDACSHCKSPVLKFSGFGTEKVESEAARLFPGARIARMDTDNIRTKDAMESILSDFRAKKIQILIGTQMIAKGFDFPHVTLVGVILADVGLMLPDFRSSERTFQLLTQVAGRAGRGTLPGRVLIQTFSPDHPSIAHSRKHDFDAFYRYEIAKRYEYHYPPYCHLINIIVRSKFEKKAYQASLELKNAITEMIKPQDCPPQSFQIIGPAPLPFYKLRGHYRWHLMIKMLPDAALKSILLTALPKIQRYSGVQTAIDVDPLNIL